MTTCPSGTIGSCPELKPGSYFGPDSKWEYGYDWFDRLVIVKRAEAADVGSLPDTIPTVSVYLYDASDNRIEFQVPLDDLVYTYAVDDADQLLNVTRQEASDPAVLIESFTHDADGNMTTRTNQIKAERYEVRRHHHLRLGLSAKNGN